MDKQEAGKLTPSRVLRKWLEMEDVSFVNLLYAIHRSYTSFFDKTDASRNMHQEV